MNTLKTILLMISIVVTNDGWRRSTCPLAHPNHPTTPTSTQNYHQQTCDNLYNPNPPQFTTTFTNPHNYSSRPHDDGRHPAATPRENRTTCWNLPQPVERSQEPTVGPLETKDSRPASLPPKQACIWMKHPSVPHTATPSGFLIHVPCSNIGTQVFQYQKMQDGIVNVHKS